MASARVESRPLKNTVPALHDVARRAIAAHGEGADADPSKATERACGALFGVLETAMGPSGLEALLRRAVQITARERPWLGSVTIGASADCPLSGLSEAAGALDVKDALEGYAALLANVLGLLNSFIGEDLTMRFVRHAWPNVSFGKLEVMRK
ncbi:MAG TPA: hypothetical protein VGD79_07450 [Thermoanaerobaculia bacterium]|jgi:hypothetical protein